VVVNIGGVTEAHDLNDLRKGAQAALLDDARYRNDQDYIDKLHRRIAPSLKNEAVRLSYLNSIANGASMSVGDVLVNKHLRPLFREKALVEANYIASTLTGAPKQQELTLSSTHAGFRVGSRTIKFGFSTTFRLKLPRNQRDVFTLEEKGIEKAPFGQHWHPYYAMPRHYRMIMSLLGVTPAASSQIKIKTFMSKFSPGHFRSDLTAEEVANALKKLDTKEKQMSLLEHIGFTPEEIKERMPYVKEIALYEDLSTSEEYSSIPDIVKSCSPMIAETLLFYGAGPHYVTLQSPELKRVVLTHFVSLIVDEMNIVCSLYNPQSEAPAFIRLPTVVVIN
jgi:hypothetical protein